MSRIPRKHVWFKQFYHQEEGICPVCLKTIIHFESKPADWHIGHILSLCNKGMDILPNTMPICIKGAFRRPLKPLTTNSNIKDLVEIIYSPSGV